ncbi:MAG: type ISP restriction/modification enzyme [Aliidongia sp.]
MPTIDLLVLFAADIRRSRAANPAISGDGTALELLIAPRFQRLIEDMLPTLSVVPLQVLPEYRHPGVGWPDLAFAAPGAPARAFIELKIPTKSIEPGQLRDHDADQFKRFCELPLWALTNTTSIRLYRRGDLLDSAPVVPAETLDPATSAAAAERLIREADAAGFERIVGLLAQARQPEPRDANEIAQVLAHAARLVRAVVEAQCREGLDPVVSNLRAGFDQTLFARAEAGGYDAANADVLFASAFAQTLIFGLLLAREAAATDIGPDAYRLLPEGTYPLLRGALRALTMDETRAMLGAGFGTAMDAVNAVDPDMLVPGADGRDPVLYLYEDFLRIFDPDAVKKFGVYYTPPEVVRLIVAEADRALREWLGVDGLMDGAVQLLDPACGTGTFLIAATGAVARTARERYGSGAVGAEVTDFARRMNGFELLVGPYTVAHYRMLREVIGQGGTAEHLGIFLTDTLAPPAGEAGVEPHLAFLSAPMVAERRTADVVKSQARILCIIGNPPYKRLKADEVERLVGPTMNRRWEDLKEPVKNAGFGRALNAFPDLYIAFYRWALWRLFEAEGAQGRGVLAFITNRGFLTGRGFGGLRRMLRRRFDHIRIIDLRGDNRGARPAEIDHDENVFNIEVGVCILIASCAGGARTPGAEASVEYADAWASRAFTRREKIDLCAAATGNPAQLAYVPVRGSDMAPLRPAGFGNSNWPALDELFTFRSNGIVTYRDDFAYATREERMANRIRQWLALPAAEAAVAFKETRDRKAGPAHRVPFDARRVQPISYRPLDQRFTYNVREYIDFPKPDLQAAWGAENVALFAPNDGIGAGPASWAHSVLPDQHAFRGSYGGWVFPLRNHDGEGQGHYLAPTLLPAFALAYGVTVTPEQVFDVALALLSATSYTMRFGRDLEDGFPHVPFPANVELFHRAAAIGARLRAVQGLAAPSEAFRRARLIGQGSGPALNMPTPAQAWTGIDGIGAVALLPDRSLQLADVSDRAWRWSISGYQVLYRWLRARNGEVFDRVLQRAILDTVGRIEEIISLCDEADAVLAAAVEHALSRETIGLPPRNRTSEPPEDDSDPT